VEHEDSIKWKCTADGQYYQIQFKEFLEGQNYAVWKAKVVRKCLIFASKLLHGKFLTATTYEKEGNFYRTGACFFPKIR